METWPQEQRGGPCGCIVLLVMKSPHSLLFPSWETAHVPEGEGWECLPGNSRGTADLQDPGARPVLQGAGAFLMRADPQARGPRGAAAGGAGCSPGAPACRVADSDHLLVQTSAARPAARGRGRTQTEAGLQQHLLLVCRPRPRWEPRPRFEGQASGRRAGCGEGAGDAWPGGHRARASAVLGRRGRLHPLTGREGSLARGRLVT